MTLASIEVALEALREGRMIILVDDEDRENEGDLCMAAEMVRAEDINFMARQGRGLICLSLTERRLRELEIPMMVQDNTSQLGTAFTVSVEARHGVTTGISAADRARTIRVAVDPASLPSDLVRPGHIFPLRAEPGGVLVRTGQTEGSVDLCRLAGLQPAGVICEIMRDDGTMARMPDLEKMAAEFDLPIVSVADVIEYRLQRESLVERMTTLPLKSSSCEGLSLRVYRSLVDDSQHLALVSGDLDPNEPNLVRVQHQCITSDVFQSTGCNCGELLRYSLDRIGEAGKGVVVYLQDSDHTFLHNVLQHAAGCSGDLEKLEVLNAEKANNSLNRIKPALRSFGIGAQILRDLGVRKMRLITTSPKIIKGLSGYGLEIVETIAPPLTT